jgi:hypothetical protein
MSPYDILPVTGVVGVGGRTIAPAVLKWAQKLGLNVQSATTQQILRCLDMPVSEYIAKFRKAGILREFPSELLQEGVTVKEAMMKSSKAKKLLQQERWAK